MFPATVSAYYISLSFTAGFTLSSFTPNSDDFGWIILAQGPESHLVAGLEAENLDVIYSGGLLVAPVALGHVLPSRGDTCSPAHSQKY